MKNYYEDDFIYLSLMYVIITICSAVCLRCIWMLNLTLHQKNIALHKVTLYSTWGSKITSSCRTSAHRHKTNIQSHTHLHNCDTVVSNKLFLLMVRYITSFDKKARFIRRIYKNYTFKKFQKSYSIQQNNLHCKFSYFPTS